MTAASEEERRLELIGIIEQAFREYEESILNGIERPSLRRKIPRQRRWAFSNKSIFNHFFAAKSSSIRIHLRKAKMPIGSRKMTRKRRTKRINHQQRKGPIYLVAESAISQGNVAFGHLLKSTNCWYKTNMPQNGMGFIWAYCH